MAVVSRWLVVLLPVLVPVPMSVFLLMVVVVAVVAVVVVVVMIVGSVLQVAAAAAAAAVPSGNTSICHPLSQQ